MGERKVLNKYYPPDFGPSKLPRWHQHKNHQLKVHRMMLPMSIRCKTCGNYISKGTKFNSRKEDVMGEMYLGIQIFRFYFKCTKCSAEITYKTDPQNSDYTVEVGATRNFEPWRSLDEAVDEARKKQDAEEMGDAIMGDAMKALENRTMDSKQEMDRDSTLDELMSMNARRHALGNQLWQQALHCVAHMKEEELAEEDEAILRTMVFHNSTEFVRRLEDNEFDDDANDVSSTLKKAKTSFFDRGGSKRSTASLHIVSSSQGPTPAAIKKASAFKARPTFVAIPRQIGLVKKEQIQLVSVEQIHHKQVVTAAGPMLSTNVNVDTTSDGEPLACLASLFSYSDDDDSSSDT